MHGDGREGAFREQLVQSVRASALVDKDDNLVKVQGVEKVGQLAVLLLRCELDEVLLETVEGELRLLVHSNLNRVRHELATDGLDFVRERRREHHHLLLNGRLEEDVLHRRAHVNLLEHLVTLVEDKVLDLVKLKVSALGEVLDAARSANDNVRAVFRKKSNVLLDGNAAKENDRLDVREVLAEALILVGDLVGELAGVAHDEDRDFTVLGLELVEGGEDKDGGLAHTRLGLADEIHTEDGVRDALVLDLRRVLETAVNDGA
mmetsp:Transcript_31688/g.41967  ORF Transcript_31688/g.41967 Transcript_31688/m.41967 type:complete len:262 (+) Transcript_31688:628-1413(+)